MRCAWGVGALRRFVGMLLNSHPHTRATQPPSTQGRASHHRLLRHAR